MQTPITSQDEFTAKLQDTLEYMALENAKLIAAQITAMVIFIQSGQKHRSVLFFEKTDIPEEWLALSHSPLMANWAVFIPEDSPVERWIMDESSEIIRLPQGETIVLGVD